MSDRHPLRYNEFDIEEARNAGKQYGIKQERERIINLLLHKYDYLTQTYGIAIVRDELDLLLELMQLIKGKQK